MTKTVPFASHEVRWFFEGGVIEHEALKQWFETVAPLPRDDNVGAPMWAGRVDDQPDVYLIVPGSGDMGIKWREGNLQIKGRISFVGTQVFCGRHQGEIERWMKWSYANTPPAYQSLFMKGEELGLVTASVRKMRALRKIRIDTLTGKLIEVESKTIVDRGIGIELTDLEVGGRAYCSLAFEAFPNDSAIDAAFTQVVETYLNGLTKVNLNAAQSMSYPAWLASIS